MSVPRRCRLAVVASHPIQYFTPLYQRLARIPEIELEVFFCRDFGVRSRFDREFDRHIVWDTDLLSGYEHRFLWNASPIRDPFNPLHAINPGAFGRLLRRYDAVWLNGYLYPSNWFAAAAAALRGTRVLVRSELRLAHRGGGRLGSLRDHLIGAWLRHSDAVLYIGQANREACLHFGAARDRLHFVPYAVDVEALRRASGRVAEQRDDALRRWGLPTDRLIVLYAGKLIERKQPFAMLRLAEHSTLSSRVHVVLVGAGPLADSLESECRRRDLRNVSLLGFVNQTRLPELYGLADVFVIPSLSETWGLVLNEAMAAGAASVVSDGVGAAIDLISDGDTGFTFPAGDWDALALRVALLVDDDGLRERIARRGAERSARYNYDAAVAGIMEALVALDLCDADTVHAPLEFARPAAAITE